MYYKNLAKIFYPELFKYSQTSTIIIPSLTEDNYDAGYIEGLGVNVPNYAYPKETVFLVDSSLLGTLNVGDFIEATYVVVKVLDTDTYLVTKISGDNIPNKEEIFKNLTSVLKVANTYLLNTIESVADGSIFSNNTISIDYDTPTLYLYSFDDDFKKFNDYKYLYYKDELLGSISYTYIQTASDLEIDPTSKITVPEEAISYISNRDFISKVLYRFYFLKGYFKGLREKYYRAQYQTEVTFKETDNNYDFEHRNYYLDTSAHSTNYIEFFNGSFEANYYYNTFRVLSEELMSFYLAITNTYQNSDFTKFDSNNIISLYSKKHSRLKDLGLTSRHLPYQYYDILMGKGTPDSSFLGTYNLNFNLTQIQDLLEVTIDKIPELFIVDNLLQDIYVIDTSVTLLEYFNSILSLKNGEPLRDSLIDTICPIQVYDASDTYSEDIYLVHPTLQYIFFYDSNTSYPEFPIFPQSNIVDALTSNFITLFIDFYNAGTNKIDKEKIGNSIKQFFLKRGFETGAYNKLLGIGIHITNFTDYTIFPVAFSRENLDLSVEYIYSMQKSNFAEEIEIKPKDVIETFLSEEIILYSETNKIIASFLEREKHKDEIDKINVINTNKTSQFINELKEL